MFDFKKTVTAALVTCAALGSAAQAETAGRPGSVSIELSTAEDIGAACRLSFVVQNHYEADIETAVYETVLFTTGGQVAKLTLLDFQDLPAGRLRVRQFQFADLPCAQIGRVLINGADTCSGAALPDGACDSTLSLSSRTVVELLG